MKVKPKYIPISEQIKGELCEIGKKKESWSMIIKRLIENYKMREQF